MRNNLRTGRLSSQQADTGYNPLDGLANLADCMLVLACGLMLALIVNWNLDLGADGSAEQNAAINQDAATKVEDMEDSGLVSIDESSGYKEMGKVYQDPETGQLYLVTN